MSAGAPAESRALAEYRRVREYARAHPKASARSVAKHTGVHIALVERYMTRGHPIEGWPPVMEPWPNEPRRDVGQRKDVDPRTDGAAGKDVGPGSGANPAADSRAATIVVQGTIRDGSLFRRLLQDVPRRVASITGGVLDDKAVETLEKASGLALTLIGAENALELMALGEKRRAAIERGYTELETSPDVSIRDRSAAVLNLDRCVAAMEQSALGALTFDRKRAGAPDLTVGIVADPRATEVIVRAIVERRALPEPTAADFEIIDDEEPAPAPAPGNDGQ